VTLLLVRLDDRLIHGQVVVGWGRALAANHVVLVDDRVRASAWEQDLFRMGMPAEVSLAFVSVDEAAEQAPEWVSPSRRTIVVAGDVDTLVRLAARVPAIREVNLGGVHRKPGRRELLPYLFLAPDEERELRALAGRGVRIRAQDVPTARAVALGDLA
jgi:PTS system mannose-specific IIB component/fructoselysine and glucoselysine-specific PTS system IIB component